MGKDLFQPPVDKSVQGRLKRETKFSGKPGENFKSWQLIILAYLEEWCVRYHLEVDYSKSWSPLKKYNSKVVFSYLSVIVLGDAQLEIFRDGVRGQPKRVWDLLSKKYDRQINVEKEILLSNLYNCEMRGLELGTNFIGRMSAIIDELAKKGHNVDEDTKLQRLRTSMMKDDRYKNTIENSLLQEKSFEDISEAVTQLDALRKQAEVDKVEAKSAQREEKAQKASEKDKKRVVPFGLRPQSCTHCGKKGHFRRECKDIDKPRTEEELKVWKEMKKHFRSKMCKEGDDEKEKEEGEEEPRAASEVPDMDLIVDSGSHPCIFLPADGIVRR
jgi:hypothetical protein